MDYFKSFVVSCELGIVKPDKRMYLKAVEELGFDTQEVVFVDDRLKNCDGARDAGIIFTYLMCRSNVAYWFSKITVRNHIVVKNFNQIKVHLEKRSLAELVFKIIFHNIKHVV